jgi:hypothetical protein
VFVDCLYDFAISGGHVSRCPHSKFASRGRVSCA